MATTKINLVVSLVPVGTRQANIGNQVFALHLSAAFAEAAAGFEKLLHPWESNWQVKKVVTAVKTTAETGMPVGKKFESDPLAERKNPPADSNALGILQNELVKNKENTWQSAKIIDKPQVIEKPSLIEAVHALSLYPGSTPNDSGVLHYFKIAPGDWTPQNADLIAAVPKLEMRFNGKKLVFTPKDFNLAQPANFNFDEWQEGWEYTAEEDDAATTDFVLKAYVKPLKIADATGIFYDATEKPSADSGLNFKDYWFRSQKSPLWQDRLEDFADAAADFEKRMAEATAVFADLAGAPGISPDLWEDLRLMSLALYAQWEPLSGTVDLPAHEKMPAIRKIVDLLTQDNSEKPALETALNTSVEAIRQSLKAGNRKDKRRLWLNVFRRAFGEVLPNVTETEEVDTQYADTLLKRAAETPEDFRTTLFYVWDSAVQVSTSPLLKEKWNAQNEETRRKIKNILDLSVVRQPFRKKILFDLTGKKTSDEVRDFIKQRLTLLRSYFENTEFVPPIVNSTETGWADLWENWNTKYVENFVAGIIDESAQVSETEPKFEAKPGGLTLQFDKLAARQNVSPKEDEANWRKIAGVGVIVREDTEGKKWHLATAATVKTSFPEVTIKPNSFTLINDKKFTIVVDVNSVVDAKHDLMINGSVFKAVFESRATSSGTIPQNRIKLTPSFAAPQSENKLITVESLDENIKFTAKDSVKFVERKPVLLANTALVPARVPYKNGIRYPFLTYNQRSLISPTALADAVKDSFNAEDQRGVKTTTWTPLYEYGAPNTAENFYKLVPLKFGKKYQMAAFMIDTAGGLPVALQDGKPFIFEPNEVVFDAAHPAPADVVQNFKYWRKVPVGQVRISALELAGENKPKTWQEIPEKVFPLAWEVEPDEEAKTAHPSEQKNRRKQLILLHEKEEKYAFGVRPPTVDIDGLERWLPLSTQADRDHLKGVLTGYFTRLNQRQPNAPADGANDLTLDDPAVEKLLFVLESYNFDERKWKTVSAHSHLLPPLAGNEITAHQRRWQKVFCRRPGKDAAGNPEPDVNEVRAPKADSQEEKKFDVVVTVAKASVNLVRLRVLALVSKSFIENSTNPQPNQKFSEKFFDEKSSSATKKFSPDKPDELLFLEDFSQYDYGENAALKTKVENEIRDFVSLKSHQILLETPNATMPYAEKLWRSLNPELTGNNDVVNISLKKDDSEKIKRRNIIRGELRRQQWRWQGRAIEREKQLASDKPDIELLKTKWAKSGIVLSPMNEDKDFLKWEMTAFAEMSEAFDLITIPIPYSIDAPDLLYRDNFEKDIAARYMRYGLRVFSRYEGLFTDARPVTTKQPYKPDEGSHKPIVQLSGTGWQRALIRYRGAKPAKPLVQAIVPLTQSFSNGEKVASLMLVLDQTAHAQCGITEEIECQLMKVDLPKKNEAETTKTLYQAGHDPILRVDPSDLPTPEENSFLTFKLKGAFGHTFDTGARQPLFASSSYVIQGNFANDDKFKFEDWDFAKIRLRRLSGEENRTSAPEEDWTDAVWVQFPPSSKFAGQGKMAVTLSGDKIFTVNAAADAKFPMFKYCLLLTEEISDFRGQKGSETYIGWVNLNDTTAPAGTLRGTFGDVISNSKNLKARLLEIQVAEDNTTHNFEGLPPNGDEFWKNLLQVENDGKDSFNAKYRITRVSPVIDVTS